MNSNTNKKKRSAFETPTIEMVIFRCNDIVTTSPNGEEWYPGQEENEGIII